MLPVTPRITSWPASTAGASAPRPPLALVGGDGRSLGLRLLRALGLDLAFGDLVEGHRGPLLPLHLDLGGGSPVELAASLGGEHDEQVAVADLLQGPLERRERHQAAPPGRGPSAPPSSGRTGRVSVKRVVRQRPPPMVHWSCRPPPSGGGVASPQSYSRPAAVSSTPPALRAAVPRG